MLFLGHSTAKALRDWIDGTRIVAGPIFRPVNKGGRVGSDAMDPRKIPLILKRMALRAGLDPARISGHSCYVGLAQDLMASGTNTAAIQQAGRWKTPVTRSRSRRRTVRLARYHQHRGD